MSGPRQWLKGGLERFRVFMLNEHVTAKVNRERDTIDVMFHAPTQKDKHLRPLPFPEGSPMGAIQDEILERRRENHQLKYTEAQLAFLNGMQELSHHLRTKNRLRGVVTVKPDPNYPNPFFKEALSVQDFYDRFSTGQQETDSQKA